jgi:DNA-directed RNA polymerase specialized sigma24 family protein
VGYLRASVVNGVRAAVHRRDDSEPGQAALLADADKDALSGDAGSGVGAARGIQVLTALRTLPRRQQEVLILRYYAQASTPEIAEALGITYGAVRSRTERGMAGLAAALDDSGEGER